MNRLARLRAYTDHRGLIRLLLMTVLVLGLLGWQQHSVPGAAAASWSIYSGTQCDPGGITGFSTLQWSGYFVASSGESYSTLWEWTASGWLIRSQAYNSDSGSSGNATAYDYSSYASGHYYTSGSHGSTFFDGWRYSNSAISRC